MRAHLQPLPLASWIGRDRVRLGLKPKELNKCASRRRRTASVHADDEYEFGVQDVQSGSSHKVGRFVVDERKFHNFPPCPTLLV